MYRCVRVPVFILCQSLNALLLTDISEMLFELAGGVMRKAKRKIQINLQLNLSFPLPLSSFPRPLSFFSGCEVDVLPVRCLHPAGGSADAKHHGGVRLAHLLHRHLEVPWLPGVYQHPENYRGQ